MMCSLHNYVSEIDEEEIDYVIYSMDAEEVCFTVENRNNEIKPVFFRRKKRDYEPEPPEENKKRKKKKI